METVSNDIGYKSMWREICLKGEGEQGNVSMVMFVMCKNINGGGIDLPRGNWDANSL